MLGFGFYVTLFSWEWYPFGGGGGGAALRRMLRVVFVLRRKSSKCGF